MREFNPLTLSFLEFHTQSAAETIQDLDPAGAAEFLGTLPIKISAPVIGCAAVDAAAEWIEKLPLERAAAILEHLDYQIATSVLRIAANDRRNAVLQELPSSVARRIRRSLRYPSGSVGAWMDPFAPTLDEEQTVADGLKFFKSRRRRSIENLIVTGAGKKYCGIVTPGQLLRFAPATRMADLVGTTTDPPSSHDMLTSIASDPLWDKFVSVPVIGRRRNVLGTISKSALMKGIGEVEKAQPINNSPSILAQLVSSYAAVVLGLFRMAVITKHSNPRSGK